MSQVERETTEGHGRYRLELLIRGRFGPRRKAKEAPYTWENFSGALEIYTTKGYTITDSYTDGDTFVVRLEEGEPQ